MTLPHLPGKLAKIGRKNSSRFQIVGIQDHAKTRFIAGFQSSEIKNGRTDVVENMKNSRINSIIVVLGASLFLLQGCAEIDRLESRLFSDRPAETREAQQIFDRKKEQIESAARARQISWAEAARRVKEADRSLAGQGSWKFDSDDEEYHAYCVLVAEQLDSGRISFAYYDALRTRKLNEIQARRR